MYPNLFWFCFVWTTLCLTCFKVRLYIKLFKRYIKYCFKYLFSVFDYPKYFAISFLYFINNLMLYDSSQSYVVSPNMFWYIVKHLYRNLRPHLILCLWDWQILNGARRPTLCNDNETSLYNWCKKQDTA